MSQHRRQHADARTQARARARMLLALRAEPNDKNEEEEREPARLVKENKQTARRGAVSTKGDRVLTGAPADPRVCSSPQECFFCFLVESF